MQSSNDQPNTMMCSSSSSKEEQVCRDLSTLDKDIQDKKCLNLSQLVQLIEEHLHEGNMTPLSKMTCLRDALMQYSGDLNELNRYAHVEPNKNYTRNLISTDNRTYSLMLLCWNQTKFSPIHDHPCDGCWMKVIKGTVQEVRYEIQDSKLVETQNEKYSSGVIYIQDSLGYHKVGNPSDNEPAMSLHLYSPPFEKCKIWLNPDHADKCSIAVSTYYSEFGRKNSD